MSVTSLTSGAPMTREPCGIFSLADLSTDVMRRLTERSGELYLDPRAHDHPLDRATVGILFTKTSTRTRTAFTAGTVALGGAPITFGPHDLQTNTGESLTDTARILGAMLDLLVARTSGPLEEMRLMSAHGRLPVINAMAQEEHPTQGICDLATIGLALGAVDGAAVLYIGEGNNTATALAHGLAHYSGCTATFVTPPGYGLPAQVMRGAVRRGAANRTSFTEVHSMSELPDQADIVYSSRWQTTGTSKADPAWREVFRPFFIDSVLMKRWPAAWFMHDLPANRGEEVAGEVLDGPQSIAWAQARMKLSSAMAALEWAAQKSGSGQHSENGRHLGNGEWR